MNKKIIKQIFKDNIEENIVITNKTMTGKDKTGEALILHVYLSSKVRDEALLENERISTILETNNRFKVFLPQTISTTERHELIDINVYQICVHQIKNCNVLLLMADTYGIDCSWEVGYAHGISKPIVTIINNEQGLLRIREDWMIKGAIHAAILTNENLYLAASKDIILQKKEIRLAEYKDIPMMLMNLLRR